MAAAVLLLVAGLVTFGVGGVVWAVRWVEKKADGEARVACGFLRAAQSDDLNKTDSFVRVMLAEGAKHAASAAKWDRGEYGALARGMEDLRVSHATGTLGSGIIRDAQHAEGVLAVEAVCGPT